MILTASKLARLPEADRRKLLGADANCHSKVMFQTRDRAVAAAKRRMAGGAPPLRVYRCKVCRLFHLTSKPEKGAVA